MVSVTFLLYRRFTETKESGKDALLKRLGSGKNVTDIFSPRQRFSA